MREINDILKVQEEVSMRTYVPECMWPTQKRTHMWYTPYLSALRRNPSATGQQGARPPNLSRSRKTPKHAVVAAKMVSVCFLFHMTTHAYHFQSYLSWGCVRNAVQCCVCFPCEIFSSMQRSTCNLLAT